MGGGAGLSVSGRRARAASFIILLVLGVCPACWRSAPGPAAAGREPYQCGQADFDDFFRQVQALDTDVKASLDEEARARTPLEQALHVSHASLEKLTEFTKARAQAASREGTPLHVEVRGIDKQDTAGETDKVSASVSQVDDAAMLPAHIDFVRALEKVVRGEAEVLSKYGGLGRRGRSLSLLAPSLEASVSKEFATPAKQQEVSRELAAAKAALGPLVEQAPKAGQSAMYFLREVAAASSAEAKPTKTRGRAERPSGPSTTGKPETAPPIAPPIAPPPSEDFNP